MKKTGGTAAFIDRLTLTEARIEAMAKGLEEIAGLARPGRQRRLPNGTGRTASTSSACARRSASSASSSRAGPTSPPTPARSASRRAMPRSCAAARIPSAPPPQSTAAWSPGSPPPACRPTPSRSSPPATAPPSARCWPGSTAISTSSCRAAARAWSRASRRRRACRSSPISRASCHVYVHAAADLAMAEKLLVNAKMRRVSVCGAAETLLVDKAVAGTHLKPLVEALREAGCDIRGDAATPGGRRRRDARHRGRLDDRISRRDHLGEGGRRRRRRHRPYRALRLAPHRPDHHRRPGRRRPLHGRGRFGASCCTTPRPSSPTAASSAWAPRSASPPAACMPAARSASSS